MIYTHLKLLRKQNQITLQQLSEKVGYGVGNLSSYENGKLNAKDQTLLRILMKGFDLEKKEAKKIIAEWRQEEFEEKYGSKIETIKLAQEGTPYNQNTTEQIHALLSKEGLSNEEIEKVLTEIDFLKNRK